MLALRQVARFTIQEKDNRLKTTKIRVKPDFFIVIISVEYEIKKGINDTNTLN